MRYAIASATAALLLAVGAAGALHAKLPTPELTPEQKAKAEDTKAKAADAAKRDGELLGKAQDRAAENYRKGKGKAVAGMGTPAPTMRK